MKRPVNRRSFLKASAVLGCGIGAAGLSSPAVLAAAVAVGASKEGINIIGPRESFSPQVGTLVSMLEWMRTAILQPVRGLTLAQLDYLHDSKANSIGALLLHLAAIERLYQLNTFKGRKWGDWDEMTKKDWGVAAGLGEAARQAIRGHNLDYYLDRLREGREHTLAELRKRDDAWLMQIDRGWAWGPTNNYCKWFHVCEHESNHSGQIKWIKRRLPGGSTNEAS
jgi:uncharacterized damage-inducible protein DinB